MSVGAVGVGTLISSLVADSFGVGEGLIRNLTTSNKLSSVILRNPGNLITSLPLPLPFSASSTVKPNLARASTAGAVEEGADATVSPSNSTIADMSQPIVAILSSSVMRSA